MPLIISSMLRKVQQNGFYVRMLLNFPGVQAQIYPKIYGILHQIVPYLGNINVF
jgi:hypothetical protein